MNRHQPLTHRVAAGLAASFLVVGVASCGDDDGDADPIENELQEDVGELEGDVEAEVEEE